MAMDCVLWLEMMPHSAQVIVRQTKYGTREIASQQHLPLI